MINPRDIEQLSAYLDGQLNTNDSARLESRLNSDRELVSVLDDLRSARGILRKLPGRRAPRNFTLTRKMVGLKPPLPRSYTFFRFSSATAAVLLLLTFAANLLSLRGGSAAAPVQSFAQCNACGGGAAATEAPAAEAPSLEQAIAPTATLSTANADSTRIGEAATAEAALPKSAATQPAAQSQATAKAQSNPLFIWQILLVVVILLSGSIMFLLSRSAMQKWK